MELEHATTKIGKRLSKSRREQNAVPHTLTDRDRAIVAAVGEYRLLSRSQIQRLLGFGATTRVNFRLQKLFHNGYLCRDYLPTLHGSSQAIYRLDHLGVPVAAKRLSVDIASLWRPSKPLKALFLAHELAINEVRIGFELAAHTTVDHTVASWLHDGVIRDRFFYGDTWHTLTPDGFIRYRVGRHILAAFIEVDRGTMSNERFKEKVVRYFAYDMSGRFTQRHEGQRFRVLVVTETPARLANLKRAAAQVAQRYCWFATLDEIRQAGVLAQIWESIGFEGKQKLVAPAVAAPT